MKAGCLPIVFLLRMTSVGSDPDSSIKLWPIRSCDIIQYGNYPDLFARLSLRGSLVISLLRNNSYSIHPSHQLGILFRIVSFSTVKSFIKYLTPPYMIDDLAILFPETNEIMLINQVERNSTEMKKAIKNVVLIPNGVIHVLPRHHLVGKLFKN